MIDLFPNYQFINSDYIENLLADQTKTFPIYEFDDRILINHKISIFETSYKNTLKGLIKVMKELSPRIVCNHKLENFINNIFKSYRFIPYLNFQ